MLTPLQCDEMLPVCGQCDYGNRVCVYISTMDNHPAEDPHELETDEPLAQILLASLNGISSNSTGNRLSSSADQPSTPTGTSSSKKSKRFSGFDFYKRKLFSPGSPPPETPTPASNSRSTPNSTSHLSHSSLIDVQNREPPDPTAGFHHGNEEVMPEESITSVMRDNRFQVAPRQIKNKVRVPARKSNNGMTQLGGRGKQVEVEDLVPWRHALADQRPFDFGKLG